MRLTGVAPEAWLHAGRYYRADPDKMDTAYRYVFRLVNFEIDITIGYYYTDTWEKTAFRKTIRFIEQG